MIEIKKCNCNKLQKKVEYNTYPYGKSYSYKKCVDCGKIYDFQII